MALVRDPNWTGPGRGPLIDDGMAGPGVDPNDGTNNDDWEEDASTRTFVGEGKNRKRKSVWRNGTQEEWRTEDAPLADPIDVPIVVKSKFTFTATQTAQINALAQQAGGYFSGEMQAYIDSLAAGNEGDAFDTLNRLTQLVTEGAAKYSGTGTGTGGTGTGTGGTTTVDEDSFSKLKELLGRLGLGSLTTNVRDLIAKGVLDGDAILFELRETPEFKTRFAGNAARVKAGLPELRPLVYVALEAQYRETMRANGLNVDLYDETKDFQALIEGDVSNAELQRRIVNGYRAVSEADPEVIRQMQELYNVTPGQLAQYFLDPANMEPVLTKQAAAAAVAARGKEQGKLQLGKLTAEDLVNRGYSEAQAMAAFKILGEQKGLYEEMSGESALTEGQKVGSVFGYDVDSVEAVKKRQATRKSPFLGGGSYTKTTGQTSGTVQTGLGVAE